METEQATQKEPTAEEAQIAKATPIISDEKDYIALELTKCGMSPGYFVDKYCQIDDPNKQGAAWFPFELWPAQREAIEVLAVNKKTIVLKARQLGLSWLTLAYALWLMITKPGSVILIFSKTDDDARELMRRLKGMRRRLPEWMQSGASKELEKELELSNSSRAKSFTTTKHSGRSFTASLVIVDEAAFIPFLSQLMNAAEETADAGGKLVVISTNDKAVPNNGFATLYRRTKAGQTDYTAMFIPWSGRPSRDAAWYKHKKKTKTQDDLWQEYPAVADEALAGLSATKRFDPAWIRESTIDDTELTRYGRSGLPVIRGVRYYMKPVEGRSYLITADTAEGDVGSDPSAFAVWDTLLWEEAAFGMAKWEPSAFAGHLWRVAIAYGDSTICVERNNHGHAVILSLREIYGYKWLYKSPFDKKLGWLTSVRTKTLAMDKTAEMLESGEIGIRSKEILAQLANIDANTMAAPEGDHDDAAMVAVIAAGALTWSSIVNKSARRRRVSTITY